MNAKRQTESLPVTTADVAAKCGCSVRWVQKMAAELGIGSRLNRQLLVFSPAEVEQLERRIRAGQARGPGHPRGPE